MSSTVVFAATSTQLSITALVSNIQAIESIQNATVLDDLGNISYQDIEIGKIVLNSNHSEGFKLSIDSQNNGVIRRIGASEGQQDEEIAYTLSLADSGGDLGNQIAEPALSDLSPEGTELAFNGNQAAPTVQKEYSLNVSTAVKGLKQGSYSDTLTISISNI